MNWETNNNFKNVVISMLLLHQAGSACQARGHTNGEEALALVDYHRTWSPQKIE